MRSRHLLGPLLEDWAHSQHLLRVVLPGSGGLALHLLTVPHFNRPVVGRSGEDGMFVRHPDSVHRGFVLVQVGDQQPLGMPP